MKRVLWAMAMAMAIAVVTACSSDAPSATRDSTSPRPSPSETPRIVDDAACPPADPVLGLPAEAGCASSTIGTFEPGAERQTLSAYALLDSERFPTEWHLRLASTDREIDRRMRLKKVWSYPVIVGSEDADLDGVDEAFIKVITHLYHSGMTHELGIFGVRNGRFFQVTRDGLLLLFQVGGVSTFGEGAECRDVDADGTAEFLLLRIEGVTNDFQNVSERTYRWKNRSLIFVKRTAGIFAKTGYSDPLLFRYYSLRCFTLDPPFPYARG